MARGSNRGGGRGQGSPATSQRGGGRGRGGGGEGGGGRGSSNYRGRGRGGIWTDMSGAGLDYERIDRERAERDKAREEAALNPPPPLSASTSTPFAPSSTPNFPYQQIPYTPRGRGGFRGRGGRGGGPPPPMPFFINKSGGAGSTFRRSQEEDDAAYASASGSGAATPHFGIGAAKKVGLGAQSSPSGRGGFGGFGGRGGYVGSNALLKPVIFVKAGTLFKEGDVAVVVRDEAEETSAQDAAPNFHVEHYSLADAAVPQMVDPRHSIEVEIASLPSTSPASPDTFLPAESPAPSAIDEVEMALELMVVEDSADEEQIELEEEEEEQDETILPSNEDIEFALAANDVEIAPPTDLVVEQDTQEEPSVAVEIEIDEVIVVVEEERELEVELVEEDVPSAIEPEQPESLGFFIDAEPATPLPPISPAQDPSLESLGFYVDTTSSSTAAPSSNATANDIPSISYSHGTVLGDHIEVDAESDEEEIVWVPTKKRNGPPPSTSFVAPPSAPFTFASSSQPTPSTPSTSTTNPLRPITFNDYSPSFTSIATTSPGGSSRKPKLQTRPGKGKKAQKAAARRSRGGYEEEAPEPREGDSDVEWGSDGPPVSRGEGKSGWKSGGGRGGGRRGGGGRSNRDAELEAAILADYIENTRGSDGEQDDEGMDQFLEGTQSIEQVEVGDIVLERRRRDEERNDSDGDNTSDGSGSSRDGLDGGVGEPGEDAGWATDDQDPDAEETKAGFGDAEEEMMAEESDLSASEEEDEDEEADDSDQAFLDALLAEDSDLLITDSDDDDESEDLAEAIARTQRQRAGTAAGARNGGGGGGGGGKKGGKKGKGKGKMVESSSDEEDSEDEEDEMFQGNFSWADEDERFIQTLLDNNADIINGKDRSAQKKLFRAIERGDFEEYEDDFVVASPTSKKSKHIPAHLQSQWDLDRSKKADFKRARAEARLENLLDPFTSGSKNSRSNDKKGKSKKGKGNVFSPDDPDSDQEMMSRAKGGGITDMVALDREIQGFLRDHGKTTMSLPPMEKESRKRVHLLAECYGLKSNSKGSGRKRFTILIKTSRTGVTPNRGKVARILNVRSDSAFYQASWSPRSGSGNHTMPGRGGGGGGGGGGPDASKRREGEVVGADSKMLGAENLGHRLLSKMGWTEGGKIGRGEGGLNVPIMATVKTSKLGLGHGL